METKICSKCKEEKNTNHFHKSNFNKDGLQAYCKDCIRVSTKLSRKKWVSENEYENIIHNRWNSLNQRCINGQYTTSQSAERCPQLKSYREKGIRLEMSKDEFKAWMLANESLHNEIVARGDKSSIDRIDESKGYCTDNIQMISLHKNIEKRFGKPCKKDVDNEKRVIWNRNKYINSKVGK